MSAGKQTNTENVDIFLNRSDNNFFRRFVQPRVDDIHSRIAQAPGDNLGSTFVTIKPNFGDKNTNRPAHNELSRLRPAIWRKFPAINIRAFRAWAEAKFLACCLRCATIALRIASCSFHALAWYSCTAKVIIIARLM